MELYEVAIMVMDPDAKLRVEGNTIYVPKSLFLEATPVGVGDTFYRHNIRLKDGTTFAAKVVR